MGFFFFNQQPVKLAQRTFELRMAAGKLMMHNPLTRCKLPLLHCKNVMTAAVFWDWIIVSTMVLVSTVLVVQLG